MVDDIRGQVAPRSYDDAQDGPFFVPPEAVASGNDVVIDMNNPEPAAPEPTPSKNGVIVGGPKKPNKLKLLAGDIKYWWGKRNKKEKIAIAAGLAIGLALAGFGVYAATKPKTAPKKAAVVEKKEEVKEPPKPTTGPSPLTGVLIPIDQLKQPVTGVMIENSPDARPQSGLKDAGVVFEAIAEGGITRFLALFQEAQPDYIGPVRSVRPYYLSWLAPFDAGIAHAGGSGEALAKIANEKFKDIDHGANGSAFDRVSNRYAPHNLYTSRAKLLAAGNSRGYTSSTFVGFPRKAEKPVNPATTGNIDLRISSGLYNVHYTYQAATNSYARNLGGAPHKDERSGIQISPKVVIAIVVPYSIHPDRVHSVYGTIGSGKAYVFQDGAVTEGTWAKLNDKDQIKFNDANGAPITLNPGQTWISAIPNTGAISYAP